MKQFQEQEQQLWRDVYTSVCRSGQGERIAAFLADSAVSAFKERFGEVVEKETLAPAPVIPKVGENWPGLDATYAGISLSQDGKSLVHLVLWNQRYAGYLTHEEAVIAAASFAPKYNSHLPTRYQAITLFENLPTYHLYQEYWYWLLNKTTGGKAAFLQDFNYGNQRTSDPPYEARVCAVSEFPV